MPIRVSLNVSRSFVLIIGCLSYALVYFHRNSISVLILQLSQKLGVSPDKINVFSSMYMWTYAILQPIGGLLADIISPGKLIFFSLTLTSIGSIIIAYSKLFWLSCVARCFIGLGCAPVYVPVVRLIANWFPARWFSLLNAIVMSTGSVGGLLSQGPLATLINHVDWTYIFLGNSILGLLLGVLSLLFIQTKPDQNSDTDSNPANSKEPLSMFLQLLQNFKIVCTNKQFHTLLCWSFTSAPTYFVTTAYWCVPYLTSVYDFKTEHAGYIVLMLSVASIIGSPLLAGFSEIVHSRKYVLIGGSVCACLSCIAFIFIPSTTPEFVLWILLFVYGLSTSAVIGVAVAMYKEMSTPETTATVTGCANFYPFFASTLLQITIGALLKTIDKNESEKHSVKAFQLGMWLPNAILTGLSVVALLFIKETFKPQMSEQHRQISGSSPSLLDTESDEKNCE